MFRPKKSMDIPVEVQGYIYFRGRIFSCLPERERKKILTDCKRAGGEYYPAVLERVTTDRTVTEITMRHCVSSETLARCMREYFRLAARRIRWNKR